MTTQIKRSVTQQRPWSSPRSVISRLAVVSLGLVAFYCGFWSMGYTGASINGSTVINRGTAVAESCEFTGPFSARSIGFWWTCQAEVTWRGGPVEQREFLDSQLTDDDVGRPVEVVERKNPRGAGKGFSYGVYREGFETKIPLNYVATGVSLVVGVITILMGMQGFLPAVRRRFGVEQKVRDGH